MVIIRILNGLLSTRKEKIMKATIGIDIGGSTTKIAGFSEDKKLLGTLQVKASDQMTSMYGALGRFLREQSLSLEDVSKIVLTGVGASFVNKDIYGIQTVKAVELDAIARGGLALAGLDAALIVSIGTGTAFVRADQNEIRHIGGSGVGGGTLSGLASHFLHESDIFVLSSMAEKGSLSKVDLMMSDIFCGDIASLPPELTAANFGKVKNDASDCDVAAALFNLVYQTVGVLAIFALTNDTLTDIVLTGSLACLPPAVKVFDVFEKMKDLYGVHFIIPPNAAFATAIGAVMLNFDEN